MVRRGDEGPEGAEIENGRDEYPVTARNSHESAGLSPKSEWLHDPSRTALHRAVKPLR